MRAVTDVHVSAVCDAPPRVSKQQEGDIPMILGRRSIEYVTGLKHDLECQRQLAEAQGETIEKLNDRLEESLVVNATLSLQLALARTDLHAERAMRTAQQNERQKFQVV